MIIIAKKEEFPRSSTQRGQFCISPKTCRGGIPGFQSASWWLKTKSMWFYTIVQRKSETFSRTDFANVYFITGEND